VIIAQKIDGRRFSAEPEATGIIEQSKKRPAKGIRMELQSTFHAPQGADFLGWRVSRAGRTEIVYEDGAAHRQVWRLTDACADERLVEAMQLAVASHHVVPCLMEGSRQGFPHEALPDAFGVAKLDLSNSLRFTGQAG
jgi:hypothetical protein